MDNPSHVTVPLVELADRIHSHTTFSAGQVISLGEGHECISQDGESRARLFQFHIDGAARGQGPPRQYEAGPLKGYGKKIQEAFATIAPRGRRLLAVAEAIVKVVDAPFGKRPFRVHIDPTRTEPRWPLQL